jgi:hypothetical protein
MFIVGIGVAIWDNRRNKRMPVHQAAVSEGALSMPARDNVALLRELADLRDRGAITDDEYEAKKAEVLGRL